MKLNLNVVLLVSLTALMSCDTNQQPTVAKNCSDCGVVEKALKSDVGGLTTHELDILVQELLEWIAKNGEGFETVVTKSHPKIVFVPKRKRGGPLFSDGKQIIGRYEPETESGKTIFLLKSRVFSLKEKSILLHELVHYAQDMNGTLDRYCTRKFEIAAYTLQRKWLSERGVPTKDPQTILTEFVNKMSTC